MGNGRIGISKLPLGGRSLWPGPLGCSCQVFRPILPWLLQGGGGRGVGVDHLQPLKLVQCGHDFVLEINGLPKVLFFPSYLGHPLVYVIKVENMCIIIMTVVIQITKVTNKVEEVNTTAKLY